MTTDQELLRAFAGQRSQDAFTALVQRHLPLVYSAAVRQVRSPELAEEVSQSVFADLARQAATLRPDTILPAWLYRTTRRTAIDVIRRESRRQNRERVAAEIAAMNVAPDWPEIGPRLDDAMEALDETDRTAILLRYFEDRSLRDVGAALGTSEDAAQKRVSRAVERLREVLGGRGVVVGSSTLAAALTANAASAAPAGLAGAIAAGVLKSVVVSSSAAVAATQIAAMTTLQKSLALLTVTGLVGTGVYEARQASRLRSEMQTLQQQQTALVTQHAQAQTERDDATRRLALLMDENALLRSKLSELAAVQLRLQGSKNTGTGADGSEERDSIEAEAKAWLSKVVKLRQWLAASPEHSIPELRFLANIDWVNVAKDANVSTTNGLRAAFAQLRQTAKARLSDPFGRALRQFARANSNQVPNELFELLPYLQSPIAEEALPRYQLVQTGTLQWDQPAIAEKAAVDDQNDSKFQFGADAYWWQTVGPANNGSGGKSTLGTNDPPFVPAAPRTAAPERSSADALEDDFEKSSDAQPLRESIQLYQALHNGQDPEGVAALMPLLLTRSRAERAATARMFQRVLATDNLMTAEERAALEKARKDLE